MPIGVNISGVPTCWGTQLNGNGIVVDFPVGNSGKLVPTCWGTQLNGNASQTLNDWHLLTLCPYLLGNTVEWKLSRIGSSNELRSSPYLLGNTVEWKQPGRSSRMAIVSAAVPTCWGTQLNGNALIEAVDKGFTDIVSLLVGEHS